MPGQIISADQFRVTRFHDTDRGFAIQTTTDVEHDVDYARALHNEGMTRTAGGDRHLARVPVVVLNAWAERRGVSLAAVLADNALLAEFLRDPDHSAFRIDKGAL